MAYSIITISRTYASGGREIGRKLAKRLGFAFYDREYMLRLARENGLAESLLSEQEEHTPTSLLYSLVTGSYVINKSGLRPTSVSLSDQLFAEQAKLIRAAAAKGPMVIVGRCADSILEEEHPFRLFLYADRSARIQRAVEVYSLNQAEAAQRIDRGDKSRSAYYQYHTSIRWGDRAFYDLMLNVTPLGIDGTVDLLETYLNKRTDFPRA